LNKKQEKAHGNDEVNYKFRDGIVFDEGDVILKQVYGVFGAGPGDHQTSLELRVKKNFSITLKIHLWTLRVSSLIHGVPATPC
jgi:hypothetical protein